MSTGLITIRHAGPADAPAIAGVHVASWRTSYAGIIAQSFLDALSVEEHTAAWTQLLSDRSASHPETFVAESSGDIVGFVAGGPRQEPVNGYDAQLHAIYLLAGAQGTGTGRMLTRIWAAAVIGRGCTAALVDVLARNPARRFYERLGARHLEDVDVVIGGDVYTEARYGWIDLRSLQA
jgi:GNAT superfamily N-acetyltransferase